MSPRTAALSGIGVVLFIGLVVATSLLLSKRHGSANELENAVPAATGAAASIAPLPTETAVPAPASATASAAPTSTATGRWTPRYTATPSKKTSAPATEEPPSSKAKCNPPFYIDKDGLKVFKPGCLN